MDLSGLVLGLGNPGARYRGTRHNLGFWVVERVARMAGVEFRIDRDADLAASVTVEIAGREVLLAMPLTYMNLAGSAAAELTRRHGIPVSDLVAVHDDADLELGRLRVRRGGGPGGHNGIRSLIEELGREDFIRVRLGIRGSGRDAGDLADYVLSEFGEAERPVAERLAALGAEAVESLLRDGLTATMNRYNRTRAGEDGGGETPE